MSENKENNADLRYRQNTLRPSRRIFIRSLARSIDGAIVLIFLEFLDLRNYQNWVVFFFVYSLIFCFFSGKTFGRIFCKIRIVGKEKKSWVILIFREFLFFLFFPVIAIQSLTGFRLFHDLLTKSYIELEFE